MALHANVTDVRKIHAGITDILARTKTKGKHIALVRTKLFHNSLGLNLPFAKFESELSDVVRSPELQQVHGQWVFSHWDDRYGMFVEVPVDPARLDVESIETFDFN